jgi:hypothetical protein
VLVGPLPASELWAAFGRNPGAQLVEKPTEENKAALHAEMLADPNKTLAHWRVIEDVVIAGCVSPTFSRQPSNDSTKAPAAPLRALDQEDVLALFDAIAEVSGFRTIEKGKEDKGDSSTFPPA